jgi:hypothetical protein
MVPSAIMTLVLVCDLKQHYCKPIKINLKLPLVLYFLYEALDLKEMIHDHTLRPQFANFLKKMYDLTGGELRIIIKYDVGEALGLSPEQTDKIVDELCDTGMIKKTEINKIVLSAQTLYNLDIDNSSK